MSGDALPKARKSWPFQTAALRMNKSDCGTDPGVPAQKSNQEKDNRKKEKKK